MNGNPTQNPLSKLLEGALSAYDFGVFDHGFLPHGRDYQFLIQDILCKEPGTYELTFTHVTEMSYKTRIENRVWYMSWSDEFTDFSKWTSAGEPAGFVFGTNWSLAYPGIKIPGDEQLAQEWAIKLHRPMHSATIETDRFSITLVYHDVRYSKVSDEVEVVSQIVVPLSRAERSKDEPRSKLS